MYAVYIYVVAHFVCHLYVSVQLRIMNITRSACTTYIYILHTYVRTYYYIEYTEIVCIQMCAMRCHLLHIRQELNINIHMPCKTLEHTRVCISSARHQTKSTHSTVKLFGLGASIRLGRPYRAPALDALADMHGMVHRHVRSLSSHLR